MWFERQEVREKISKKAYYKAIKGMSTFDYTFCPYRKELKSVPGIGDGILAQMEKQVFSFMPLEDILKPIDIPNDKKRDGNRYNYYKSAGYKTVAVMGSKEYEEYERFKNDPTSLKEGFELFKYLYTRELEEANII